jgi:hypothetical protein
MKILFCCLALAISTASFAQDAGPAPTAPEDQPKAIATDQAYAEYERAIAPYVEQARQTYPDARHRFMSGQLGNRPFFVTVRLSEDGRYEDCFVRVLVIDEKSGDISGKIANDIQIAKRYRNGQRIIVHEADVRDWTIANPDGSEEGNVVGKFLSTYQTR